ncbi:MAG: hypothetical protein ACLR4Z_05780 [Butyricicoccaceae bacterium]
MADAAARFDIVGSDIDPECVKLSISDTHKAGVAGTVFFEQADATSAITAGGGICLPIRPTVSGCSMPTARQSSFIRRSAVRRKIRR